MLSRVTLSAAALLAATTTYAATIERADFDLTASTFGFETNTLSTADFTVTEGSLGSYNSAFTSGGVVTDKDPAERVVVSFTSAVSAFGANYLVNSTMNLEAFDVDGVSLGLVTEADATRCGAWPCGFIGFDAGANVIASVVLYSTEAAANVHSQYFVVDNFIYQTTAAVPVPASVALLGSAVAGLGVVRRMKKAA